MVEKTGTTGRTISEDYTTTLNPKLALNDRPKTGKDRGLGALAGKAKGSEYAPRRMEPHGR